MFRKCRKAAFEAMKRGDLKTAFMGTKEARGYLELIAKLGGEFFNPEPARQHQPMFTFKDPFTHIHIGCGDDIDCPMCEAGKVYEAKVARRSVERKALPPGEIE